MSDYNDKLHRLRSQELEYLAETPTYDQVEAWYIHECQGAYSLGGIPEVMAEAIKRWPEVNVAGLYVVVLLVITKLTRENPTWAECTIR